MDLWLTSPLSGVHFLWEICFGEGKSRHCECVVRAHNATEGRDTCLERVNQISF